MKITIPLLVLVVSLLIFGCQAPNQWHSELDENEVLYKNPNPQIEALHVKAYNYDLGIGVEQDRAKANVLYLEAAKLGDVRSMMNYAISRYSGVGIEADPIDAFYWIDKARFMTQKSPDMKLKWRIRGVCDEMEKGLTREQKREARSRP